MRLIEALDEKTETSTGVQNLVNGLSATKQIKELDLNKCLTPALGKMSPQFTATIPETQT